MSEAKRPVRERLRSWWRNPVDLWQSVALLLPLWVLYEVGVALQMQCSEGACRWRSNGVDLLTRSLVTVTGGSPVALLGLTLLVAVGLLAATVFARRRGELRLRSFLPVLAESALYASVLGPVGNYVTRRALLGAGEGGHWFLDVCTSCGAGLHEELVFRLALFAGGSHLLRRAGLSAWRAGLLAAAVSSLLFSAVHHVGALGDPFTAHVFAYRVVLGLCLAGVYRARGLAIAAWTHALYDIAVFTSRDLLG